jgi:tetratricopeptide (TPR) repeat protein
MALWISAICLGLIIPSQNASAGDKDTAVVAKLTLEARHIEDSGALDQAEAHYYKALEEAKRVDSKKQMVEIISRLVRVQIENHKLMQTGPLVQEAVDAVNTLKNPPIGKPSAWDSIVNLFCPPKKQETYVPAIAVWMNDMAETFYTQGERTPDQTTKEFCLGRCLELKLPTEEHFSPNLVSRACLLITDLTHQGRYSDSLPFEERLISYLERTNPDGRDVIAAAYANLFGSYLAANNPSKAELAMNQSLRVKDGRAQDANLKGTVERNVGTMRLEQGNVQLARALYQQAMNVHEGIVGTAAVQTGWDIVALGLLEEKTGNFAEAGRLFKRSLDCFEKCPIPEVTPSNRSMHPDGMVYSGRAISAEHLAQLARREGAIAFAKKLEDDARKIRTLNPHWVSCNNPAPDTFYLIWGYFPFAIEIIPNHLN